MILCRVFLNESRNDWRPRHNIHFVRLNINIIEAMSCHQNKLLLSHHKVALPDVDSNLVFYVRIVCHFELLFLLSVLFWLLLAMKFATFKYVGSYNLACL